MYDNADLEFKLQVRQKALAKLNKKPELVIDAFSGEGVIASLFWSANCTQVICIERDSIKAANNPLCPIVGDNNDYIHLFNDADVIDCDAYGLVMPLIEQIPTGKMVVFTDGTPEKARKNYSAWATFKKDFERLLKDGEFFISQSANVIYGYGVRK